MGTQGHRTVDTREIEKTRCFHVFACSKKSLRVVLAPCKCCVFFVEPVGVDKKKRNTYRKNLKSKKSKIAGRL